jgi:hypothetical protein
VADDPPMTLQAEVRVDANSLQFTRLLVLTSLTQQCGEKNLERTVWDSLRRQATSVTAPEMSGGSMWRYMVS